MSISSEAFDIKVNLYSKIMLIRQLVHVKKFQLKEKNFIEISL